jgi:hypothetical protein
MLEGQGQMCSTTWTGNLREVRIISLTGQGLGWTSRLAALCSLALLLTWLYQESSLSLHSTDRGKDGRLTRMKVCATEERVPL